MYMLDSNSPINLMCLEAFAQRVRGKKTERIMDAGLLKGEFESKLLILISLLHYSLILSTLYYVGSYLIMYGVFNFQTERMTLIISYTYTIQLYISAIACQGTKSKTGGYTTPPQCTKYSEPDSLASACVVLNV